MTTKAETKPTLKQAIFDYWEYTYKGYEENMTPEYLEREKFYHVDNMAEEFGDDEDEWPFYLEYDGGYLVEVD